MLSRTLGVIFGLSVALGLISLGCMAGIPRPTAVPDRAPAAASAVPAPVPVSPYSTPVPSNTAAPQTPATGAPVPAPLIRGASETAAPPPNPVAPAPGSLVQASGVATQPVVATPPAAVQPVALNAPTDGAARIRELYRQAVQSYNGIDSYIARLRRREVINGEAKPEELMQIKFRKQPFSVYFKWLGTEGKGREAIYVKGQYEGKLHTLLAAGDMPFAPAGKRFSIDPESILVRSRSRHPITESGIGFMIEQLGKRISVEGNGTTPLRYLGPVKRPEYEAPMECVEEVLADGGSRRLYFDATSHLPVMVITRDPYGRELEYYLYDRLQYPVKLDDHDFNPDKLWPAKN